MKVRYYDSYDSYNPYNLPIVDVNIEDIKSSGTYSILGVDLTITKSGSIYTGTLDGINLGSVIINGALRTLLGNADVLANDLSSILYLETSYNMTPDDSSVVSPYFLYQNVSSSYTYVDINNSAGFGISDLQFADSYYTFIARVIDGNNNYLGFGYAINRDGGGGYTKSQILFTYETTWNINNLIFFTDPGDKGFRPRGELTKHVLGGGSVSGTGVDYNTDTLTQPGAPDESSASIVGGAGFINIYKVSETNLAKVGHCLFSDTIMTAFQSLLVNPMDSIISLNIFPCSPDVGGSEPINLFRWVCAASGVFALGTLAQGQRLSNQFKVYDFGTLSVAEMWESFLDYDATSFELYLPFIGAVDIPVGEVMNGSINVAYTVDFVSGMCVANVLCTKTATLSSGKVTNQYAQHSYTGNCAMNVPLSAINYGNMIGSFVSAAASGLRAPMSIVTSALEGKMQPTIETKGTVGGNAGFCSVLYPYITVTRPITAEPDSYQEVMGYPSYINTSLGECSDLCVCDEINLTGLSGATDGEIERIRQICKEGIFV